MGFSSMWRRSGAVVAAVLLAVVAVPQAVATASPQGATTTASRAAQPGTGLNGFPEGYFFIRNVASGKVLDVKDNSKEAGASIILWGRKAGGYDNQLWKYDNGFLVNKNSGLCLEVQGVSGTGIPPGTAVVQAERRERPHSINQLWAYNYQHLMPYDPKVSLWGENGDVNTPGTKAVVGIRIHHEITQQWMFDTP
ncbi:RICIN domain-containing protein [Actinosynnema sp. CS-041913]|uniref:RICIN domain-containing protein n=1 Tax=Actinosynnema sp. CS-041913 TaxID=3239917 RepID=UPI003D94B978